MSWTKKSGGPHNAWLIASELITLSTDSTDKSTSVIDFLRPGVDFLVALSPTTALSGTGTDIDVDVNHQSTGTFGVLKADLMTNKAATGFHIAVYDVSSNGEMPYYKVRLDPDTGMAAKTATVYILQRSEQAAS